ncbi:MAG: DUF3365 domain-containing protein [Algoriphagus sp.]|nr:DUF3365 domain-containing protein [Algoriphagus sp.]
MKNGIYIFLIIFGSQACGPQERVSKEVFDAVNKNMEVKKLSESEIIQEAMIWGDSISTEAQKQLISNLQKAIEEKGVAGAIGFCNVEALPILKTVSEKHGVTIRRASNRYRNPADQPDVDEAKILDAYEYNAENGLKNDPNIQKIEGGEVYLYTKAIVIPGAFCLSCHGDPDKDIDTKTLAEINSLYPSDKAKGHKVGDLRGMWSIKIPKKEVVGRL